MELSIFILVFSNRNWKMQVTKQGLFCMEWRCSAIQTDIIAFSGSICYTRVHNAKVIEYVIRSSFSLNQMLLPALGFMICQNLARGSVYMDLAGL